MLLVIDDLQHLIPQLLDGFDKLELLDEQGRVPSPSPAMMLIERLALAEGLSRGIVRLAVDFAQGPHSAKAAGTDLLADLATAASHASSGVHNFARAAQTATRTPPHLWAGATTRMVLDHAAARRDLLRAAEALGEAEKGLRRHLGLHRFFRTPAGPEPATATKPRPPTDPIGPYVQADALRALTDRLNGAASYAEAAVLLDQILEPTHGLLDGLGDLFEAAAEKTAESDYEDGVDLQDDFGLAAASVRALGEDLRTVVDRMRILDPVPHSDRRAGTADHNTAVQHTTPVPTMAAPAPPRRR